MKNNVRKSIAGALQLPSEVALDQVRIILTGQNNMLAENHKGIIEYGRSKIVFRINSGFVEVLGEGLTISSLQSEELAISGEIIAICFVGEDGR